MAETQPAETEVENIPVTDDMRKFGMALFALIEAQRGKMQYIEMQAIMAKVLGHTMASHATDIQRSLEARMTISENMLQGEATGIMEMAKKAKPKAN